MNIQKHRSAIQINISAFWYNLSNSEPEGIEFKLSLISFATLFATTHVTRNNTHDIQHA